MPRLPLCASSSLLHPPLPCASSFPSLRPTNPPHALSLSAESQEDKLARGVVVLSPKTTRESSSSKESSSPSPTFPAIAPCDKTPPFSGASSQRNKENGKGPEEAKGKDLRCKVTWLEEEGGGEEEEEEKGRKKKEPKKGKGKTLREDGCTSVVRQEQGSLPSHPPPPPSSFLPLGLSSRSLLSSGGDTRVRTSSCLRRSASFPSKESRGSAKEDMQTEKEGKEMARHQGVRSRGVSSPCDEGRCHELSCPSSPSSPSSPSPSSSSCPRPRRRVGRDRRSRQSERAKEEEEGGRTISFLLSPDNSNIHGRRRRRNTEREQGRCQSHPPFSLRRGFAEPGPSLPSSSSFFSSRPEEERERRTAEGGPPSREERRDRRARRRKAKSGGRACTTACGRSPTRRSAGGRREREEEEDEKKRRGEGRRTVERARRSRVPGSCSWSSCSSSSGGTCLSDFSLNEANKASRSDSSSPSRLSEEDSSSSSRSSSSSCSALLLCKTRPSQPGGVRTPGGDSMSSTCEEEEEEKQGGRGRHEDDDEAKKRRRKKKLTFHMHSSEKKFYRMSRPFREPRRPCGHSPPHRQPHLQFSSSSSSCCCCCCCGSLFPSPPPSFSLKEAGARHASLGKTWKRAAQKSLSKTRERGSCQVFSCKDAFCRKKKKRWKRGSDAGSACSSGVGSTRSSSSVCTLHIPWAGVTTKEQLMQSTSSACSPPLRRLGRNPASSCLSSSSSSQGCLHRGGRKKSAKKEKEKEEEEIHDEKKKKEEFSECQEDVSAQRYVSADCFESETSCPKTFLSASPVPPHGPKPSLCLPLPRRTTRQAKEEDEDPRHEDAGRTSASSSSSCPPVAGEQNSTRAKKQRGGAPPTFSFRPVRDVPRIVVPDHSRRRRSGKRRRTTRGGGGGEEEEEALPCPGGGRGREEGRAREDFPLQTHSSKVKKEEEGGGGGGGNMDGRAGDDSLSSLSSSSSSDSSIAASGRGRERKTFSCSSSSSSFSLSSSSCLLLKVPTMPPPGAAADLLIGGVESLRHEEGQGRGKERGRLREGNEEIVSADKATAGVVAGERKEGEKKSSLKTPLLSGVGQERGQHQEGVRNGGTNQVYVHLPEEGKEVEQEEAGDERKKPHASVSGDLLERARITNSDDLLERENREASRTRISRETRGGFSSSFPLYEKEEKKRIFFLLPRIHYDPSDEELSSSVSSKGGFLEKDEEEDPEDGATGGGPSPLHTSSSSSSSPPSTSLASRGDRKKKKKKGSPRSQQADQHLRLGLGTAAAASSSASCSSCQTKPKTRGGDAEEEKEKKKSRKKRGGSGTGGFRIREDSFHSLHHRKFPSEGDVEEEEEEKKTDEGGKERDKSEKTTVLKDRSRKTSGECWSSVDSLIDSLSKVQTDARSADSSQCATLSASSMLQDSDDKARGEDHSRQDFRRIYDEKDEEEDREEEQEGRPRQGARPISRADSEGGKSEEKGRNLPSVPVETGKKTRDEEKRKTSTVAEAEEEKKEEEERMRGWNNHGVSRGCMSFALNSDILSSSSFSSSPRSVLSVRAASDSGREGGEEEEDEGVIPLPKADGDRKEDLPASSTTTALALSASSSSLSSFLADEPRTPEEVGEKKKKPRACTEREVGRSGEERAREGSRKEEGEELVRRSRERESLCQRSQHRDLSLDSSATEVPREPPTKFKMPSPLIPPESPMGRKVSCFFCPSNRYQTFQTSPSSCLFSPSSSAPPPPPFPLSSSRRPLPSSSALPPCSSSLFGNVKAATSSDPHFSSSSSFSSCPHPILLMSSAALVSFQSPAPSVCSPPPPFPLPSSSPSVSSSLPPTATAFSSSSSLPPFPCFSPSPTQDSSSSSANSTAAISKSPTSGPGSAGESHADAARRDRVVPARSTDRVSMPLPPKAEAEGCKNAKNAERTYASRRVDRRASPTREEEEEKSKALSPCFPINRSGAQPTSSSQRGVREEVEEDEELPETSPLPVKSNEPFLGTKKLSFSSSFVSPSVPDLQGSAASLSLSGSREDAPRSSSSAEAASILPPRSTCDLQQENKDTTESAVFLSSSSPFPRLSSSTLPSRPPPSSSHVPEGVDSSVQQNSSDVSKLLFSFSPGFSTAAHRSASTLPSLLVSRYPPPPPAPQQKEEGEEKSLLNTARPSTTEDNSSSCSFSSSSSATSYSSSSSSSDPPGVCSSLPIAPQSSSCLLVNEGSSALDSHSTCLLSSSRVRTPQTLPLPLSSASFLAFSFSSSAQIPQEEEKKEPLSPYWRTPALSPSSSSSSSLFSSSGEEAFHNLMPPRLAGETSALVSAACSFPSLLSSDNSSSRPLQVREEESRRGHAKDQQTGSLLLLPTPSLNDANCLAFSFSQKEQRAFSSSSSSASSLFFSDKQGRGGKTGADHSVDEKKRKNKDEKGGPSRRGGVEMGCSACCARCRSPIDWRPHARSSFSSFSLSPSFSGPWGRLVEECQHSSRNLPFLSGWMHGDEKKLSKHRREEEEEDGEQVNQLSSSYSSRLSLEKRGVEETNGGEEWFGFESSRDPLVDTQELPVLKLHTRWGLIEVTEEGDFCFAFKARSELRCLYTPVTTPCKCQRQEFEPIHPHPKSQEGSDGYARRRETSVQLPSLSSSLSSCSSPSFSSSPPPSLALRRGTSSVADSSPLNSQAPSLPLSSSSYQSPMEDGQAAGFQVAGGKRHRERAELFFVVETGGFSVKIVEFASLHRRPGRPETSDTFASSARGRCGGAGGEEEEERRRSRGRVLKRYHRQCLPERQRLRYQYACEVVACLKENTPKVVLRKSGIGVFQLMSNAPPSDFKATFTSSFSLFISSIHIRQGVACIVSRVGDKVYLPIEDISLVLTARDLIEEDLFRSFSSSSSSYTSSFFSSSGSRGAPPPFARTEEKDHDDTNGKLRSVYARKAGVSLQDVECLGSERMLTREAGALANSLHFHSGEGGDASSIGSTTQCCTSCCPSHKSHEDEEEKKGKTMQTRNSLPSTFSGGEHSASLGSSSPSQGNGQRHKGQELCRHVEDLDSDSGVSKRNTSKKENTMNTREMPQAKENLRTKRHALSGKIDRENGVITRCGCSECQTSLGASASSSSCLFSSSLSSSSFSSCFSPSKLEAPRTYECQKKSLGLDVRQHQSCHGVGGGQERKNSGIFADLGADGFERRRKGGSSGLGKDSSQVDDRETRQKEEREEQWEEVKRVLDSAHLPLASVVQVWQVLLRALALCHEEEKRGLKEYTDKLKKKLRETVGRMEGEKEASDPVEAESPRDARASLDSQQGFLSVSEEPGELSSALSPAAQEKEPRRRLKERGPENLRARGDEEKNRKKEKEREEEERAAHAGVTLARIRREVYQSIFPIFVKKKRKTKKKAASMCCLPD